MYEVSNDIDLRCDLAGPNDQVSKSEGNMV